MNEVPPAAEADIRGWYEDAVTSLPSRTMVGTLLALLDAARAEARDALTPTVAGSVFHRWRNETLAEAALPDASLQAKLTVTEERLRHALARLGSVRPQPYRMDADALLYPALLYPALPDTLTVERLAQALHGGMDPHGQDGTGTCWCMAQATAILAALGPVPDAYWTPEVADRIQKALDDHKAGRTAPANTDASQRLREALAGVTLDDPWSDNGVCLWCFGMKTSNHPEGYHDDECEWLAARAALAAPVEPGPK